MGDEAAAVRETAVRGLAQSGGEEAFAALVAARWDSDYRVSKAAVLALGSFGPAALPALQEALEHNRLPNQAAVEALEQVGETAVPLLLEALNHDRLPARRAAANALARLLAGGALPASQEQAIRAVGQDLTVYVEADLLPVLDQNPTG
jgi:HEAT repeat protein